MRDSSEQTRVMARRPRWAIVGVIVAVAGCGDVRRTQHDDPDANHNDGGVEVPGSDAIPADANVDAYVPPVSCGNGVQDDVAEECDDGNDSNNDGCLNNCKLATCGDGYQCTDMSSCSSGPTGAAEECDDGNLSNSDSCLANCGFASCGDGHACLADDCTTGPGGGPEECDDGNDSDSDACLEGCVAATCGDGHQCTDAESCTTGPSGGVEECDDGDTDNSDTCLTTCAVATCGDGHRCTDAACTSGATGGVEECDDGDTSNNNACLNSCEVATCGDTYVCNQAGCTTGPTGGLEACDDGDTSNNNACLNSCANATCGDHYVCNQTGCTTGPTGGYEACDDGDTSNNNACLNSCAAATCGDHYVCSAGGCTSGPTGGVEACDDGDTSNTNACLNNCADASCGDGHIWAGVEECEPPGLLCDAACLHSMCAPGSDATIGGPYAQYGYCWYLGDPGVGCDAACGDLGGGNHNAGAGTAWEDNCERPDTDDISTWFFENGNPAGWSGPGEYNDYRSNGHGDVGGLFYGKCSQGLKSGSHPKEINNGPERVLACACFETCPAASGLALGGPYEGPGNYCYYLGERGETCDDVCTSMGGENWAYSAGENWLDSCETSPAPNDVSTWFYDHENLGGWTGPGTVEYNASLGYGYAGGVYFGKCMNANMQIGAFPNQTETPADIHLICACFQN